MAEKETIIIELDFDTSDFTQSAAKLNKQISDLNKEQKELKKSGEEGSIQYQKNTEALKENKKELNETNKVISNLTTANKANVGSNEQLKAQLSILTLEYNKLSKEQRESGERGKDLFDQINQTTESLKGNEEAVGDNRRSVGNYEKANKGLTKGFGKLDEATGGYGNQLKALLANPVVLVITGIVAVFALLKKSFTRSEEGSNKLGKAQAVLSGIFTAFLDLIEPIAAALVGAFEDPQAALSSFSKAVKENIINRFNGLLELIPQLGKAIGQLFEGDFAGAGETALNAVAKVSLGVEDMTGKIESFGEKALAAANKATILADAEAALVKSQRTLRILQLEFLKDAEKQRQIRDDESLSIEERTAANEKLGEILKQQSKQELAIANQALKVANQRIALDGASSENLDQRASALEEIADINERITGQESEQLVNINSLKRDALALDLEIKQKRMDAAVEVAQFELDEIIRLNQRKIEEGKFLTDELFSQEQERLSKQLDAQKEFELIKLEQGATSQIEYNSAINSINEENASLNEELLIEKAEADEEQRIVDLENKREIDILNAEAEFALRQEDLNRQREQEILNAENTGADKKLIDEKFDKFDRKLRADATKNSLAEASQVFGDIAALAEQGSLTQKALAVAQATINGFLSVTSILAAPPSTDLVSDGIIRAARIATAIATNAVNIGKIASTQAPKKAAKGGIFGGNLHSNGGTKGYFDDGTQVEVERGELFAVVNRNSTGMLNNLSNLNEAGGGVSFGLGGTKSFLQDGGIGIDNVSGEINSEIGSNSLIVSAIESIPSPVVVVQDINEVQGETVSVEQRANF